MIMFTAISQTLFHGSDIFLAYWYVSKKYLQTELDACTCYSHRTNKNQNETVAEVTTSQHLDVLIYSALISVLFLTTILRAITFFAICMRASFRMHNAIFTRLLRAPVAFFDSNPVGRILNRFSRDLGIIDERLPYVAFDLNLVRHDTMQMVTVAFDTILSQNLIQSIGVVITVSLVNWYLIFPAIFLAIIIYFMRRVYTKSSLDIKRFEGVASSPVFSHVTTTINGMSSIRAFQAQGRLEKQFHMYLNDCSASWILFVSTSRAFGFFVEWICIIYIAIITLSVMLSKSADISFLRSRSKCNLTFRFSTQISSVEMLG